MSMNLCMHNERNKHPSFADNIIIIIHTIVVKIVLPRAYQIILTQFALNCSVELPNNNYNQSK